MLILHAFFLWLMVSTLIIGGAVVFHRRFPEESPWFGFIIPTLVLVLLFNFIEHIVALPVLWPFLPFLLGGALWLIAGHSWRTSPLLLPTAVFLGSFLFTFAIRCIEPEIDYTGDQLSDLHIIANYSQGAILPPPDMWVPGYLFQWYYGLQHYAASILKRLLSVDIGQAYNVSHALLSAVTCVVAAAVAWRISDGRRWITLAVPFLIVSCATGSSAYLILTSHNNKIPDYVPSIWSFDDLSDGMIRYHDQDPRSHDQDQYGYDQNPIWPWLYNGLPDKLIQDPDPNAISDHQTLRLQVPGFWTWRAEYHANAGGHFLTLLALLAVVELTVTKSVLWPWLIALFIPVIARLGSAWAVPITALLCWPVMPLALLCGRRPAVSFRSAIILVFFGAALILPACFDIIAPGPPRLDPNAPKPGLPVHWTDPLDRVPLREFLVQWWPILILWIGAIFSWRRLSFSLRWVLFVVPLMLIGIELVTVESRYNTIEKMWGYTWGVGLVAFFPVIASSARPVCRAISGLLLISALITISAFLREEIYINAAYGYWSDDGHHPFAYAFDLSGDAYLTQRNGTFAENDQRKKILAALAPYKGAVFLSGKIRWCYNEAPAIPLFTGNKSYFAWPHFVSLASVNNLQDEADRRQKLNDDFYSGAMTNRLQFLQNNKITGVLIWPDDQISDEDLARLHTDLDPAYNYIDCRGKGKNNAGVFLLRTAPGS